MAVYTNLSDSDLSMIRSGFALEPFRSVIGVTDGEVESTYVVVTSQEKYILTIFETAVEMIDLEGAFRTMEELLPAKLPCPKPLRTVDGAPALSVGGKLIALVSFVEGYNVKDISSAQCHDLGVTISRLHIALGPPVASAWPSSNELPKGNIHGAVKRDNVFFTGDAVSGLINFRWRRSDYLISEIAEILVAWCSADERFIESLSASFITGYESIRSLTELERASLPTMLLAQICRHYVGNYQSVEDVGFGDSQRAINWLSSWKGGA